MSHTGNSLCGRRTQLANAVMRVRPQIVRQVHTKAHLR
jgi:hypothetical protein